MKKSIISRVRILAGLGILFVIMGISTGCTKGSMSNMTSTTGTGGNGSKGTGAGNAVSIENMSFVPSSLSISAGTTVTWTNNDMVTHTVTSTPSLFDSGAVAPGGTFTYTFINAGTYSYYCKIHTHMTGKVVTATAMTMPGY
jgi:plastocyanin